MTNTRQTDTAMIQRFDVQADVTALLHGLE